MKLSKQTIRKLAGHWNKDPRTIRRWLKKESHPFKTHPETLAIIKEGQK